MSATSDLAAPVAYADSAPPTDERYRAGTLRYTRAGLFLIFTWMLWGDFCFQMMERVIPQVMPLQLKSLGASNTSINLLVSSLPAVMNMFITPIVSVRSDRHRSARGRRIPFLVWPTPFLTVFLILLGYSPQIGHAIQRITGGNSHAVTLTLFGVFMVAFQIFNMVVGSVYYYLFNDVVPAAFLGRFVALFGIVGAAAGFFFNLLIFPYAESHASEIYLGMGVLYFVAFFLMCRYVREGEYPPPPVEMQRERVVESIRTYFRECFSDPFYVLIFARISFWSMAMTSMTFVTFFGQQIGLDLTQVGRVNAANVLVLTLALYPMGAMVDRFHPVRMHLLSLIIIAPLSLAIFFFARGYWSFLILSALIGVPMALMSASVFPLINAVFPRDRFGQFCSAQALLNAVALLVGSYLSGAFMDWVGNYRFLYLWMAVCQLASAACMGIAYLLWKQRGLHWEGQHA